MIPLPVELESRLDEIRSEIAQDGAELIDLLYRRANQRSFLTFLVDKPGGITLEECAAVNHRLSRYFDQWAETQPDAGFLQGSYFLEVNSPGLDRPLKSPKDFERAMGQTLRVQVREANGTIHAVVGKLTGIHGAGIEVDVNGQKQSVFFEMIFKATRDVLWR